MIEDGLLNEVLKLKKKGFTPDLNALNSVGYKEVFEYMSNTKPIPADKIDLAVATAMAGEMLGHKLIYLEAGSGAVENVNTGMIREVRSQISIPLIVGGGIHTAEQIRETYKAGADIIVVGSAIEQGTAKMERLLNSVPPLKLT